ncbi:MAG: hypothetical protein Q8Q08_12925 [Candidatus Omnitrophota bacterium]|nr:hypothetical protein [Candidatus Omnitrophota bacterium]
MEEPKFITADFFQAVEHIAATLEGEEAARVEKLRPLFSMLAMHLLTKVESDEGEYPVGAVYDAAFRLAMDKNAPEGSESVVASFLCGLKLAHMKRTEKSV